MSALGQKATCAPQKVMSALSPKADIRRPRLGVSVPSTNARYGTSGRDAVIAKASARHERLSRLRRRAASGFAAPGGMRPDYER
jgi:hypothetical protein